MIDPFKNNPLKNVTDQAGKVADKVSDTSNLADNVQKRVTDQASSVGNKADDAVKKAEQGVENARQRGEEAVQRAEKNVEEAKQKAEEAVNNAEDKVKEAQSRAEEKVKDAEKAVDEAQQRAEEKVQQAEKAVEDAQKKGEETVKKAENAAKDAQKQVEDTLKEAEKAAEDARKQGEQLVEDAKKQADDAIQNAGQAVDDARKGAEQAVEEAKNKASEMVDEAQKKADETVKQAEQAADNARKEVEGAVDNAREQAEQTAREAEQAAKEAKEKAEAAVDDAKRQAEQAVDDARKKAEESVAQAEKALEDAKAKAEQAVDDAKAKAEEMAAKAEEAVEEAKKKVEEAIANAEQAVDDAKKQAEEMVAKAEQALEDAKKELEDAVEKAEQALEEAKKQAEEMIANAEQALEDVKKEAQEMVAKAEKALEDAKKWAEDTLEDAKKKLEDAKKGVRDILDKKVVTPNLAVAPPAVELPREAPVVSRPKTPAVEAPAIINQTGPSISRIELGINAFNIKKFVDVALVQTFDQDHLLTARLNTSDVAEQLTGSPTGAVSLKELTEKWGGERLTLTFLQGETDASGNLKPDKKHHFTGVVTGVQLVINDAVDNTVVIYAKCPTAILNGGPHTRTFTDMKLGDIVEAVLAPYKSLLKSSVTSAYSSAIAYTTQYDESDRAFLQRLARKYGEWFYYDGNEVVFGKQARKSPATTELENGGNLLSLEYDLRLVSPLFTGVNYDYFSDEKLEAASSDQKLTLKGDAQLALAKSEDLLPFSGSRIGFSGFDKTEKLQKAVLNKKADSANNLALLKGRSTSLDVKIGDYAKVQDNILENGKLKRKDDYGVFTVTSVSHRIAANGYYENTFEAIPMDPDYPPVAYKAPSPKADSQPAKVIDVADPENMGRVKVRFYWQQKTDSTPWIRVANLMSGDSRGVYFTPEVDEVVFVDFEFGNPDLPFVRGSMYRGSEKPGESLFHKENHIKGIITRGGNHIVLNDEGGKEQIRIFNKESQNEVILTLEGETKIGIKSEGKIVLEAKEIEMKAEKISMDASDLWKVEAQKAALESQSTVDIESQSNMKLLSQSNVDVAGQMGVKVEGMSVSIEGKTQTSVKGNAQLALEGGAQASLRAAMVMIN